MAGQSQTFANDRAGDEPPIFERFADRHIGPSAADIEKMLAVIGAESIEDLIDQAVPPAIRSRTDLDLPEAVSEPEVVHRLRDMADRNRVMTSLIGMGYHDTVTPPVILRKVLENPAWYTAYTPYQAEISQGRLELLLNFQTMVSDLTGMEVANASLLDEGTAAAEAMMMARRLAPAKGNRLLVASDCHPQTIAVIGTRAEPVGIEVVVGDPEQLEIEGGFGLLLQYPGTTGRVKVPHEAIERAKTAGLMVVVAADLLSLLLLDPPGEWGADITVGTSQRFGVPLGFGGPHAAYLATWERHVRAMPGRLVGVSHDAKGRVGLRLALQTREQHIRRERATSNVCTAQVLLAMIAGLYACWHGPERLSAIARRVHDLTCRLAAGLEAAGLELVNDTWFDTLAVKAPAGRVIEEARRRKINLRRVDEATVGIALDETTTPAILTELMAAFGAADLPSEGRAGIPETHRREGPVLAHPVFHMYQTEHEMLRYLRRLSDKDLALDRTMIPLGSCTMKLNATTEMTAVTFPEFARIHPFAPLDQAPGYLELIRGLERWLASITGYDAVSLQPNAGSQGELAGLLAIRAYHKSNGESERDVCLIPSSAHGTNAASAVMAGMRVVVVACDDTGNVDLDDLGVKVESHADHLAAIMVTYPSTHGVFEDGIVDLCRLVHENGGQVYVDGANLNALVGIAKPGEFGADVSHLNLHKTFTIPHGGGGPGVGPVAVKTHLAPFLPNHPLQPEAGPATGVGPIAAAPWGSAGVLPIPWAYIALMGPDGLRRATEVAILSANYLATRLAEHYEVLYTGNHDRVAHECIIDLRPLTRAAGITAEDVAKRLADYKFHAPTVSFPVVGTLMIEPTESEPLSELDRFCEAMVSIRDEIRRVEEGIWPADDNPLRNAPHPAEDLIADVWDHPYTRTEAGYPLGWLRGRSYFVPVGRVEGAAGDRNLVCSCPPIEAYRSD